MVGTVLLRLGELQECFGKIVRKRRTPILIRHNTDTTGFTGFFENRFDEILAVLAVKPRRTDDEVLGTEGTHEDFACPFRAAVGADGADGISFLARRGIGTRENVIGGDVQQRAALTDDIFCEVLRTQGVYFEGTAFIGLAAVNICYGCCVYYKVII